MLIVFLSRFSTINFNNNNSSQEVQRDAWLQCTELQEQFGGWLSNGGRHAHWSVYIKPMSRITSVKLLCTMVQKLAVTMPRKQNHRQKHGHLNAKLQEMSQVQYNIQKSLFSQRNVQSKYACTQCTFVDIFQMPTWLFAITGHS